ncbi:rhomboid family intramembrane serine protease [Halomarina ordinaria]|uniref:Rhomboid family intramembrane serine protease n=1 Tax=Halomarina ordinaria TaxID=3033939 RepID=A0ABD5UBM3_9EURY|nr:rhomboid family intramembrane serine protease [Halomarina sp. PSRA2]
MSRSPTAETLVVMGCVFLAQQVFGLVGLAVPLFALGPAFPAFPWTVVTSVYAHANLAHLLGNAFTLALVGLIVERSTTRFRFHAFFLTTGVLAGLVQVFVLGSAVIGASGAIFALVGYLVTANPVSTAVFSRVRLSRRGQLALFAVLGVVVTVATGAPGVALLAHFTGFVLGLAAGRLHLLDVGGRDRRESASASDYRL